jgi:hypothetical protein
MSFFVIAKPSNKSDKFYRFLVCQVGHHSKTHFSWSTDFNKSMTFSNAADALNLLDILPKGCVYLYEPLLQQESGFVLQRLSSDSLIVL